MNEIQRFVIPACLAFLLHGILAHFTLQKQPPLISKQKGIPISVSIDSAPRGLSPDVLPAPEKEEISPEPAQPEVTAEQIKPEPAQLKAVVEQVKPEPVQPEAIVEQDKPEPVQPEAVAEPAGEPSIPAIKPAQRKRIVTPVEIRQNPVTQKTSAITVRQQEPLSQSESVELPEDAGNHMVMNDRAAERRPAEKNSAAVIDQEAIPAYRHNEQPLYPLMAKRRGYQGKVVLHVLVDTRGSVSEIEIKASSGHSILDKTALATVLRWQFFPATRGGKPVAMWVDVPIDFRLQ